MGFDQRPFSFSIGQQIGICFHHVLSCFGSFLMNGGPKWESASLLGSRTESKPSATVRQQLFTNLMVFSEDPQPPHDGRNDMELCFRDKSIASVSMGIRN
jgi:hypothetical protein